jgi:uncharacterized protein YgiM (DUF1202 family)
MPKKIYINPGHSNVDPGAVGYETERKLNVKVSEYMNDYLLKNYECETKMTSGTVNSTNIVVREANQWKADLLVSNHFNAGGGDGYEALVVSDARIELGKVFDKHVKAIGQNSRGVKIRPNLNVLKNSNMPAVLNEGAFVDNKADIADWNDNAELKKMGEAYAKAAAEYLNLPKKNVTPVVKPIEKAEPVVTPEVKPVEKVEENTNFRVKVTAAALNVRKGPGVKYAISTVIRDKGVYTIVEESNECWGKLKSGAGWINLKYTKKI